MYSYPGEIHSVTAVPLNHPILSNLHLVSRCPFYSPVCVHSGDGVLTLCLQLQREILSHHTEQATKTVCKGFRDLRRGGRSVCVCVCVGF